MPTPDLTALKSLKERLIRDMDFEGAATVREVIVALGDTSEPLPELPTERISKFPLDGVRAIEFLHPTDITKADVDHFLEFLTTWKKRLPGESMVCPNPWLVELAAYQRESRVAAIRAYRARTGLGLKESKEAIDRAAITLGLKQPEWEPTGEQASRSPLADAVFDDEE